MRAFQSAYSRSVVLHVITAGKLDKSSYQLCAHLTGNPADNLVVQICVAFILKIMRKLHYGNLV